MTIFEVQFRASEFLAARLQTLRLRRIPISPRAIGSATMHVLVAAALIGTAASSPAHAYPPLPYGPYTCKPGFVWREAIPEDKVCVQHGPGPADIRRLTADENAAGPSRLAGDGPFGPDTCLPGFVWRETRPWDHVCVPPGSRDRARVNNENAALNLLYPPALPNFGITLGDEPTTWGGKASSHLFVVGAPTFTRNHDIYFYLWDADRGPGSSFLAGAPIIPWKLPTNDINGRDGVLPQDHFPEGTYLWPRFCVDTSKKAFVILLDTGTGVTANLGAVDAPCYRY